MRVEDPIHLKWSRIENIDDDSNPKELKEYKNFDFIYNGSLEDKIDTYKLNGGLMTILNRTVRSPNDFVSIMMWASFYGYLNVIKWLHENDNGLTNTVAIDLAAAKGHLEIVKFLYFNREEGYTIHAVNWAAEGGHFEVLKFFHEHNFDKCDIYKNKEPVEKSYDSDSDSYYSDSINQDDFKKPSIITMDYAAKGGNLEILKWLNENKFKKCSSAAVDWAAENGHLEILQWIHENTPVGCTTNAMDSAAENGHLEVVKWLHENTPVGCTTNAMDSAARGGYLEVVKWLHENRTEGCTSNAIRGISYNGHLEIIKFFYENIPLKCNERTIMEEAIYKGHINIIKWLLENVFFNHDNPRSTGTFEYAIESYTHAIKKGHLEIVQLFYKNFKDNIIRDKNNLDEMYSLPLPEKHDVLYESGLFQNEIWVNNMKKHQSSSNHCLNFMDLAALYGQLEVLKWFHFNTDEKCTALAIDNAVENEHFEVMKWLHENTCEGCTPQALTIAIKKNRLDFVKFICENKMKRSINEAIVLAGFIGNTKIVAYLNQISRYKQKM